MSGKPKKDKKLETVILDPGQLPTMLIHPDDNVVIITADLPEGIPAGHKIARRPIACGSPVLKYGDPIGHATRDIRQGQWVHTHNMQTSLKPQEHFTYNPAAEPMADRSGLGGPDTFSGYLRDNGRAGIRNEIWIVPTVGCVNKTAEKLAAYGRELLSGHQGREKYASIDTVAAWPHPFGCSQIGDDLQTTRQILQNLTLHPNAGGVLVLGLGCENNQIDLFRDGLGAYDPERIQFLETQSVDDELAAGRQIIRELIDKAGQDQRMNLALDHLVIGLKCGGSDAFSGLTANPLLGRFSEWLVQKGGSTLLTEVPEMFGADHILLSRTTNAAVFRQLADLLQDFRDYYTRHDQPVYENPSPGNKDGGLTTLEDKSLGCTQKAGRCPVVDVLDYGMFQRQPGLSIVAGPGNDMVACTALAAAGAQMILFTTGRGTPLGGPVPTVKVSTNRQLAESKPHWIDFDASPALNADYDLNQLDRQFIEKIISLANGEKQTCNEQADYREIALFKQGVIV